MKVFIFDYRLLITLFSLFLLAQLLPQLGDFDSLEYAWFGGCGGTLDGLNRKG